MDAEKVAFEEIYDAATLRRLDGAAPSRPVQRRSGLRTGTFAGALLATTVRGLGDALEPEGREVEIEIEVEHWRDPTPRSAISVHLVPDDPPASVFYLRT